MHVLKINLGDKKLPVLERPGSKWGGSALETLLFVVLALGQPAHSTDYLFHCIPPIGCSSRRTRLR